MKIILEPQQPPKFEGNWRAGEARAVLVAALQWLDNLPLVMEQPQEKQVNDGE